VCQWRWLDHAPGGQSQQIDPVLGQPGDIAKAGALARPAWLVVGRGIERAGQLGNVFGSMRLAIGGLLGYGMISVVCHRQQIERCGKTGSAAMASAPGDEIGPARQVELAQFGKGHFAVARNIGDRRPRRRKKIAGCQRRIERGQRPLGPVAVMRGDRGSHGNGNSFSSLSRTP